MNALLEHVWGKSRAQDRVWKHVTGLAPAKAVRRLIMALDFQAFIDESVSSEEFVLGGYIAPAAVWAKFSSEWEALLPLAVKNKNGVFQFKMSEMATGDRASRVQTFYNVIENYEELVPISFRMNLVEFKNAQARAQDLSRILNISFNLNSWGNPYYFSFRVFLDQFHIHAEVPREVLPEGETVDFIFDDRSEKKFILAAWDEIKERLSDHINMPLGSAPRFEDDQKFLPLQAADLWAWWVREWYEEDSDPFPTKMKDLNFGRWRGKPRKKLVMTIPEEGIFEVLKSFMVTNIAEGNTDPISAAINRGEL